MDGDTIIGLAILNFVVLILTFKLGHAIGDRDGFRRCSAIWDRHTAHTSSGYHSPLAPERRTPPAAPKPAIVRDVLDAQILEDANETR